MNSPTMTAVRSASSQIRNTGCSLRPSRNENHRMPTVASAITVSSVQCPAVCGRSNSVRVVVRLTPVDCASEPRGRAETW